MAEAFNTRNSRAPINAPSIMPMIDGTTTIGSIAPWSM